MIHLDQPDRRPIRLSVDCLIALALLAALAAGCGKDFDPPVTSPSLSSQGTSTLDLSAARVRVAPNRGLVDLTTGSRRTIESESRTRLVYDDPTLPPDEDVEVSTSEWVVVGPEVRFGTEYVHVRVSFENEGEPMTNDFLYREDRSGFYQVFPHLTNGNGELTHAGPPGEALPDETTLLAYPLHPNASWPAQSGSAPRHRVVAREELSVPAGVFSAWRIEDLNSNPETGYRETLWYSTPGLIAVEGGVRTPILDVNGQRIGTRHSDWSHRLTSWTPGGAGTSQ